MLMVMPLYRTALILSALATFGLAHSQTYTLRRQFHAGEVDKYASKLSMNMAMSFGAGNSMPMDMSMDQDLIITTKKVLQGGNAAEVEMTTHVKHADMGKMAGM